MELPNNSLFQSVSKKLYSLFRLFTLYLLVTSLDRQKGAFQVYDAVSPEEADN